MLRHVAVFAPLTDAEVETLAERAVRRSYGPNDRVVVQGDDGASLFYVRSGALEVLVRQPDGHDLTVATLEEGAVFGEAALLTGAPRSATIRAIGEATLLEIGREALQPSIERRPQLVIELALLLAARQVASRERGAEYARAGAPPTGLVQRIFRFLGEKS